jgi:hypothetical protein
MHRCTLLPLLLTLALLSASPVLALDYDESRDGDLSELPDAPTSLALEPGSNIVTGRLDGIGDIRDYMSFTIPSGQALSSILLLEYVNAELSFLPGNRGFHAIAAGPTSFIPSTTTAGLFLGGDHLDAQPTVVDLLPILAGAPLAGTGFDVPLGPGTYTYHVQQTSPEATAYSLEFVVVPEPSTAVLLLGGLALMRVAGRARRDEAAG